MCHSLEVIRRESLGVVQGPLKTMTDANRAIAATPWCLPGRSTRDYLVDVLRCDYNGSAGLWHHR